MEKHVHELFNDDILRIASSRFQMDKDSLKKIGGFENYVYGYTLNQENYVLRITHSSHRDVDMVLGELEWVEYLALHGASVCMPVYSTNSQLVEKIDLDDGSYFILTAFHKAKGQHVNKGMANHDLYYKWGKAIGKMHALTKDYTPKKSPLRPTWYEDKLLLNCEEYLPEGNEIIIDKLNSLINKIKQLPQDKEGYGLIHTDVHSGNFFVDDNGNITIFDFDDCSYMYFISDIAIALFYCLLNPDTVENRIAFSYEFLDHFFRGYREENHLDYKWIKLLPDFLKLRELDLYVVIYRSCDMNNPGPWEQNYMNNRKYNIEHDVPFIGADLDLSRYNMD